MKRFAALFFVIISFFVVAAPVYAVPLCPPGFTSLCNINPNNLGGLIGAIVQIILIIAIISSLIFLLWGGVKYISSGGDKGKIDSARGMLTAAIIGLVISLSAFLIVNIVLMIISGQGLSGLQIPKLI